MKCFFLAGFPVDFINFDYTDIFTGYRVIIVFVHNFGGESQGKFCHFIMYGISATAILVLCQMIPQGPGAIVSITHMTLQISNIQLLYNNRVNYYMLKLCGF